MMDWKDRMVALQPDLTPNEIAEREDAALARIRMRRVGRWLALALCLIGLNGLNSCGARLDSVSESMAQAANASANVRGK